MKWVILRPEGGPAPPVAVELARPRAEGCCLALFRLGETISFRYAVETAIATGTERSGCLQEKSVI